MKFRLQAKLVLTKTVYRLYYMTHIKKNLHLDCLDGQMDRSILSYASRRADVINHRRKYHYSGIGNLHKIRTITLINQVAVTRLEISCSLYLECMFSGLCSDRYLLSDGLKDCDVIIIFSGFPLFYGQYTYSKDQTGFKSPNKHTRISPYLELINRGYPLNDLGRR